MPRWAGGRGTSRGSRGAWGVSQGMLLLLPRFDNWALVWPSGNVRVYAEGAVGAAKMCDREGFQISAQQMLTDDPRLSPGPQQRALNARWLWALIMVLCLSACAPPRSRMNELNPGMTKAEVVNILGEPDSSRLRRGQECYVFSLWRDFWNRRPGNYSDRYFTCFIDGRLTEYGRIGDEF